MLERPEEAVAIVEDCVVKFPVPGAQRADEACHLIGGSVCQAQDGTNLRNFCVVAERHIGEDADLRFERRQQPFVERGVDEIADQRRIASQSVGEGVVFQALLFEVEHEGGGGEAQVGKMRVARQGSVLCQY